MEEITISDIEEWRRKNHQDRQLAKRVKEERKKKIEPYSSKTSPKKFRLEFYREIEKDMLEDGFLMTYPHGNIIRQAKRSYYYRGENQIYQSCKSSLWRYLDDIDNLEVKFVEQFVADMRIFEFQKLVNQFQHIKSFTEIGVTVLYEQLAQHYGLRTKWLDITNDIDIALFFACCKYNKERSSWLPLNKKNIEKSDENRYGILYKSSVQAYDVISMSNPDNFISHIYPIGFQPFMRCHYQTGYAMIMEKKMDLQQNNLFKRYKFKHSIHYCNFIYEKIMEKGKKVFPNEGLNKIQDKIDKIANSSSKKFCKESFEYAFKNYDGDLSKTKITNLLKKHGYIIKCSPFNISRQRKRYINRLYKYFDIEKEYNINLSTRLGYYDS